MAPLEKDRDEGKAEVACSAGDEDVGHGLDHRRDFVEDGVFEPRGNESGF